MIILYIIIGVAVIVLAKLFHKLSTRMCKSVEKMENKVVIITGSNTGIGFETALDLAKRGAKVILACRDENRGTTARDKIIQTTGNKQVLYKHLDLASFKSVRKFAENILKTEKRLHVLINNAGLGDVYNSVTEDNLPLMAQVNHFSPFLLTVTLLPLLKASAPSRIINVSSILHRTGTIDLEKLHKHTTSSMLATVACLRSYSDTKLANILFTRKLSSMLRGTGVTANSLHPGAVNTQIFRDGDIVMRFVVGLFFITAFEGAQTSIHLAVSKDVENVSGKYFANCRETKTASKAEDDDMAEKLWKLSDSVVSFDKKTE